MTPESPVVVLVDFARGAIGRLAREQDAIVARADCRTYLGSRAGLVTALATSRGEAARALRSIVGAVIDPTVASMARSQAYMLDGRGNDAIPSATLRAWEAGWAAYADTLAGAP